jgi:CRISPR-associated protein Csx17
LPLLRAERVDDAVRTAARRLRAAGLVPLSAEYTVARAAGRRLAAALLFPVDTRALRTCDEMVLKQPDAGTDATQLQEKLMA